MLCFRLPASDPPPRLGRCLFAVEFVAGQKWRVVRVHSVRSVHETVKKRDQASFFFQDFDTKLDFCGVHSCGNSPSNRVPRQPGAARVSFLFLVSSDTWKSYCFSSFLSTADRCRRRENQECCRVVQGQLWLIEVSLLAQHFHVRSGNATRNAAGVRALEHNKRDFHHRNSHGTTNTKCQTIKDSNICPGTNAAKPTKQRHVHKPSTFIMNSGSSEN